MESIETTKAAPAPENRRYMNELTIIAGLADIIACNGFCDCWNGYYFRGYTTYLHYSKWPREAVFC